MFLLIEKIDIPFRNGRERIKKGKCTKHITCPCSENKLKKLIFLLEKCQSQKYFVLQQELQKYRQSESCSDSNVYDFICILLFLIWNYRSAV